LLSLVSLYPPLHAFVYHYPHSLSVPHREEYKSLGTKQNSKVLPRKVLCKFLAKVILPDEKHSLLDALTTASLRKTLILAQKESIFFLLTRTAEEQRNTTICRKSSLNIFSRRTLGSWYTI
jgi:hypothetical protein